MLLRQLPGCGSGVEQETPIYETGGSNSLEVSLGQDTEPSLVPNRCYLSAEHLPFARLEFVFVQKPGAQTL